jgi:hypothetical protein
MGVAKRKSLALTRVQTPNCPACSKLLFPLQSVIPISYLQAEHHFTCAALVDLWNVVANSYKWVLILMLRTIQARLLYIWQHLKGECFGACAH